jgi:hypothetical protein
VVAVRRIPGVLGRAIGERVVAVMLVFVRVVVVMLVAVVLVVGMRSHRVPSKG